jgi:hypothetical protein
LAVQIEHIRVDEIEPTPPHSRKAGSRCPWRPLNGGNCWPQAPLGAAGGWAREDDDWQQTRRRMAASPFGRGAQRTCLAVEYPMPVDQSPLPAAGYGASW